jgi:hypothetical protein
MTTELSFDELIANQVVYRPEKKFTIEVTPEMAKRFLEKQGPQRNIRLDSIDRYANDMKSGQWHFNGAPIVFDIQQRMRDGQNRMHALVKAGVPQVFEVLLNASEETIATIDTGRVRTFSDVTRMQGIPYATQVAGASSHWWKYDNNAMNRNDRPSIKQIENIRDRHLPSIKDACRAMNKFKTATTLLTPSVMVFVFAYIYERSQELAWEFMAEIDKGVELVETDAVYALRRVLINNQARRSKLVPTIKLALAIKAFNARIKGKPVLQLGYRSGEEFPKFIL